MKKRILWLFLLPISLMAQNTSLYTIQVGTFVNPKVEDFQLIQPYGYLYAEPFGDSFSKVYLGEFSNLPAAEATLAVIKAKGYSAFIAERTLDLEQRKIIVQFTTKKTGIPINWGSLESVGKLYALIENPTSIKIVTGPFIDLKTARSRTVEIQKIGYKDAFVKTINPNFLHEVSSFELGKTQIKKDLNSVVEAILNDDLKGNVPQSYETTTSKIAHSNNTSVATTLPIPDIKAKVKRTAALDIQSVLKSLNYYNGSLDGFYGKGTKEAYQKFEQNDFQYKKHELLFNYFNEHIDKQPAGFQGLLNNLPTNPEAVLVDLKKSKEPLAKAYQAYWLLANGGNTAAINSLMNAAIQTIFSNKKLKNSPPFDFNATYSYERMEQLILHLRFLHAAPDNQYAIPCWLFERHPKEAFDAFKTKSKFASFASTKIDACKSFDDWKPLKIMNTIIADLQPSNFSKKQLSRKATLEAGRSFMYLFPEKLDKKQKEETDKWLIDFWDSIENTGNLNPVLAKRLPTLKVLFFQSQVLLEDFYMNKKFSADEAEGLALSVLKTYVDVPLGFYVE